jgi:hypothetical protein
MKTKTIAMFVLLLTFGMDAKSEENSLSQSYAIPGGLVYSNGKDAVFLQPDTGKKYILTYSAKNAVVKWPFAVSDNGRKLIWRQDGKLQVQNLPLGIPEAVKVTMAEKKTGNNLSPEEKKMLALARELDKKNGTKSLGYTLGVVKGEQDIVWPGEIKRFSISPDGDKFTFDGKYNSLGWVMLDQGNPAVFQQYYAAGAYKGMTVNPSNATDPRFQAMPLYAKGPDSIDGIFYLSTRMNSYYPISYRIPFRPSENSFVPAFGNLCGSPPVPYYKATSADIGIDFIITSPIGKGLYGAFMYGGELLNDGSQMYRCDSIKKSAEFLVFQKLKAWENGEKKAAFIYHIGDKWGPIEIKTLDDASFHGGETGEYSSGISFNKKEIPEKYTGLARELEILTDLPKVTGLAWKPDGSLSAFTEQGNVCLFKAEDIQKAFANSKMTTKQDKHSKNSSKLYSADNVCRIQPQIIASGISGSCFYWVSDESFIFCGTDRNTYRWTRGKTEKIADSIGEFSYCSVSPFEGFKNFELLSVDAQNKNSTEKISKK